MDMRRPNTLARVGIFTTSKNIGPSSHGVLFIRSRRSFVRKERCVRIRGGATRDALRAAGIRPESPERAAQLSRIREAIFSGPSKVSPVNGPSAGGAVSPQGGSSSCPAHPQVPHGGPEEPAVDERSGASPGADRARNPKKQAPKCLPGLKPLTELASH